MPKFGPAAGLRGCALALVTLLLSGMPGQAQDTAKLDATLLEALFPDATALGEMTGDPPAAPVFVDDALAGYLLFTRNVIASTGYSGKPLDVAVGLDLEGRITGAQIVEQHEPILMIGVSPQDLEDFVAQYIGLDVREPVRLRRRALDRDGDLDAVVGATISSVVLNDAILRAARAVGRSRGLFGMAAVDFETYSTAGWQDLIDEGSLVGLRVPVGQAIADVAERGGSLFPKQTEPRDLEAPYFEIFAGLATPARVGRNLLGEQTYNRALGQQAEGGQLLFIAANGLYSFKGTNYVRSGVFDRFQLVQGDRTFTLQKDDYTRIDKLDLAEAPELREMALFSLPATSGFDPAQPWYIEFMVRGERADDTDVFEVYELGYRLPDRYRRADAAAAVAETEGPLWHQVWRERIVDIVVLTIALTVLAAILVFEDAIARRQRLYHVVRFGFLTFTLLWLGWYAGAQLSVLNVLTFTNALREDFRWEFFLLDPLLFILWSFVAAALLFWGRGVFCGWLCPFGALQELTNRLANLVKVPQVSLPFALHERLWPVKYVIFLGLFALSLEAMPLAQVAAEVEPFKTAVVLRFQRSWEFVVYPLGILVVGLFVQRVFCRYLCPLGAALAIPARLHMFDWLKRRWHCGTQCQICAVRCPVQAIHPNGKINPNECVHCLQCQVNYFDDRLCPPLIERRKRREARRAQRKQGAKASAKTKAAS